MPSTPDTRSTSAPGESRNGHFNDAAATLGVDDQRSIMARVLSQRGQDQDGLSFPGDSGDD